MQNYCFLLIYHLRRFWNFLPISRKVLKISSLPFVYRLHEPSFPLRRSGHGLSPASTGDAPRLTRSTVYNNYLLHNITQILPASRLSMTIRHDGVPAKAVSPLRVDYCFLNFHQSIIFITFAGTPPTMALAGTSFVTTAPAATMAFSPIVTPCRTVTLAPSHTRLPI